MRTILITLALISTLGTQAAAECGKLCDPTFWRTATTADVQAEIEAGADVTAQDSEGWTPLHWASMVSATTANIQILMTAGADAMAQDVNGTTPWDLGKL